MTVRDLHAGGVWLLVIAIFAALQTSISAQVVFFAGTGNHYEYVSGQMSWDAAVVEAETHSYMNVSGHLVTITSSEENEFLNVTFASGEPKFFAWINCPRKIKWAVISVDKRIRCNSAQEVHYFNYKRRL